MYPIDLEGKNGIVFGIANQRSIAWSIAQILHKAGARLAVVYQNDRLGENVRKLVSAWDDTLLIECDASSDDAVGIEVAAGAAAAHHSQPNHFRVEGPTERYGIWPRMMMMMVVEDQLLLLRTSCS